jgi:hypothetical protein
VEFIFKEVAQIRRIQGAEGSRIKKIEPQNIEQGIMNIEGKETS